MTKLTIIIITNTYNKKGDKCEIWDKTIIIITTTYKKKENIVLTLDILPAINAHAHMHTHK